MQKSVIEIRVTIRLLSPGETQGIICNLWDLPADKIAAQLTAPIERVSRDPESGLMGWNPSKLSNLETVLWLKENATPVSSRFQSLIGGPSRTRGNYIAPHWDLIVIYEFEKTA